MRTQTKDKTASLAGYASTGIYKRFFLMCVKYKFSCAGSFLGAIKIQDTARSKESCSCITALNTVKKDLGSNKFVEATEVWLYSFIL